MAWLACQSFVAMLWTFSVHSFELALGGVGMQVVWVSLRGKFLYLCVCVKEKTLGESPAAPWGPTVVRIKVIVSSSSSIFPSLLLFLALSYTHIHTPHTYTPHKHTQHTHTHT